MDKGFILGIWDGHDAGAALIKGEQIIFAINEERLTRRKLEVGFPDRSIRACLGFAGIFPEHIKYIAASTSDPAKTLTRIFPSLKEEYYLIRRRKKPLGRLGPLKRRFKYWFTEFGPNLISRYLSRKYFLKKLKDMGFEDFSLHIVGHHEAHAQSASRCSGFKDALVITLDGVGDGLSGSIWEFRSGKLIPIRELTSRVSFGIFFEHVTNLLNMRELEDEGKVMALANYAYPVADNVNPLIKMIKIRGLQPVSRYRSWAMHKELKRILWQYPSEQFAYMAQKALEKWVAQLVENALRFTGLGEIALAGGIFSNIKLNMRIDQIKGVKRTFVFPHMGDGGLAVGAAMSLNFERFSVQRYHLNNLYFGSGYKKEHIRTILLNSGLPFTEIKNLPDKASQLIRDGQIVLWFQGRMEFGPRALGNRSILARPDQRRIKDRLNLALKKRVWYQPFCPSILREDASEVLVIDGRNIDDNPFMTTAFPVKKDYQHLLEGVTNIDGTCRPHLVGDENPLFRELLVSIKGWLGKGIVLNTSFNIHGEPVVCSPEDALITLKKTRVRYLFLEEFLIENPDAENR